MYKIGDMVNIHLPQGGRVPGRVYGMHSGYDIMYMCYVMPPPQISDNVIEYPVTGDHMSPMTDEDKMVYKLAGRLHRLECMRV